MTLLELTVVISLILLLLGILAFGARAWKRGSDRAMCVIHIQTVQKAVRAYSNLYGYSAGQSAPGLQSQVIGLGRFVEVMPTCPSSGTYTFGQTFGIDTIPPVGTLYMECSLASTEKHEPDSFADW
jgi:type II secretory pathway pseudopilin PulG